MIYAVSSKKRNTKLLCCLSILSLSVASVVSAEPIRDEFSDKNISDGDPIRWIAQRSTISFDEFGLRLENSNGEAAIMQADVSNSSGWSMRVLARLEEGDVTGLGTASSPVTWAILNPNGNLFVGEGGNNTLASAGHTIDTERQDFFLQLDTFDNELRAWAWPVGAPPASQEPMVTASFSTLTNASPAFWVRDFSGGNGGLGRSVFHWFEYSDEHIPIPVPEPTSGVMWLCVLAGVSVYRGRRTT